MAETRQKALPKISIIVPVYNTEKYLRRCLDSIAAQTFTDWECICVDDGSPDASGAMLDAYARRDARFCVIHQENGGVSRARNTALDAARGEYVGFVDSDDWIESEMISTLYDTAIEHEADAVVSGYKWFSPNGKIEEIAPKFGWMDMPKDFVMEWQGPCAKLFKRTILHKENIRFPEGITLAEDLFFTFQVFFRTQKVFGINKAFYSYFWNENSATHTITIQKIGEERTVLQKIENTLEEKKAQKEWYVFLTERKCRAKNKYIFKIEKPNYSAWRNCYPEVYKDAIHYSRIHKKVFLFVVQHKLDFLANILFLIWHRGR